MANTPPSTIRFAAAEKTSEIINRKHESEVDPPGDLRFRQVMRVVLLRGPRGAEERHEPEGGYGKTRLLEEVVNHLARWRMASVR